ncbi:MAG: aldo/keto reductase, partial [Kofleriaceae bacterium]
DRAPPAAVLTAIVRALGSRDPWVRAQACRMPITDATLGRVIEQLGDPDDGVRGAAHDALAAGGALDARLARLLDDDQLSAAGRAMAHAWLARALDDAAVEHARAALPGEQDSARQVLAAVAGVELAPPSIAASPPIASRAPPSVEHRELAHAGFAIAPLVISGAFDLSPDALALAADAGVDTYFWEPGYDSLTAHLRAHRAARVVTGSYHADAASIEADVDRALRRLGRTALDVFLLFWSRSPARVDAAAFALLDRLKRAGKLRAIGFSTHQRGLARDAIEAAPWDVVMIRHSAAHPAIESELLPVAQRTGTAILTFSALCYGRMVSGACAPSPADCYRYSLSQPGVVGCISAPRRRHELIENLAALRRPSLDDAELATLRAHGVGVRVENQRFNALMRQPTRDAAAAARELLAAELPPADEVSSASQPRAAASRGTRSRLGTVRRRR